MPGPKKNKYGLTDRQTKYAAARAAGKSQIQSYDAAGYSNNQSDTSKRVNACKLEKDPAIQKHIEYLNSIAEKHMLEDIDSRKAALIDIYLNSTNEKSRLKALDLLNRMHGDYIDKKEINATIQGISRDDRLSAMQETLESLKKAWNGSDGKE